MGAHYGSIQVRSRDRSALQVIVEGIARETKNRFLLGPELNGWIGIYPDESGQDAAVAATIAQRFSGFVLHLMVYDDDIFAYSLFRDGAPLNEYASRPDYFGEVTPEERERQRARPETFRDLIGSEEKITALAALLDTGENGPKFTFEQERLDQFAGLLGIENTFTSYEYLMDNDRDGIRGWKDFIHVPDLGAEKAARKAAKLALRTEKARLQKTGLLFAEHQPPGRKQERINAVGELCFSPDGALFVIWKTYIGPRMPPALVQYTHPWVADPEPIILDYPIVFPANPCFSSSGRWFAFHDRELRLWDWRQRKLVTTAQTDAAPVTFSADETALLCRRRKTLAFVSLEAPHTIRDINLARETTGLLALHSSKQFIATRHRQDQLGIIDAQTGALTNVLFIGRILDWSGLAPTFVDQFKQAGVELNLDHWKQEFVRGAEQILNLEFSPDGRWLCAATTGGLCVWDWSELLAAQKSTPPARFQAAARPELLNGVFHVPEQYENYVHAIAIDEVHGRVLFAGIEGRVRHLSLKDGSSGVLLDPPGRQPISSMRLSPDRQALVCLTSAPFEERRREHGYLQIWNYPALCQSAGL